MRDAQSTKEQVQVISGSAESCPENVFKEQKAKQPEPVEAEGKGTLLVEDHCLRTKSF